MDCLLNLLPCPCQAFGDALASGYIPNLAIVDCTASDAPPANYLDWMKKGINIITPNKKLGSGPLDRYQAVRKMQRESYIHFFYEVWQAAGHRSRSEGQVLKGPGHRTSVLCKVRVCTRVCACSPRMLVL